MALLNPRQIKSQWQDEGFDLRDALKWLRSGVTDPAEARRLSQAGKTPEQTRKDTIKTPEAAKRKASGAQVLIRVTRIMDFYPLSEKARTDRAKQRDTEISSVSSLFEVDNDAVIYSFGRYLADIIRLRVKEAVATQMIAGVSMKKLYPPLSDSYKRRKVQANRDRFWVNTDWLIKNLKVWKYKREIFIGYPPGHVHAKGRAKASLVMMWVEQGTKKMPARALFGPVVKAVSKRIDDYWKYFYQRVVTKDPMLVQYMRQSYKVTS